MLHYNLNKKFDQTYKISFIGSTPQQVVDVYMFETEPIIGLLNIKSFSDYPQGETDTNYFKKYFKYKNGENWSELLPIEDIINLEIDRCEEFILKIFYYNTSENDQKNPLYVNNIVITGEYHLTEFDSEAVLENEGDVVILSPKDIYKIFRLDGYEIISNHDNHSIQYRFTQDDGRSFTEWEPLTQENISTKKLNPLRFAQVQYSITNNSIDPLIIFDIILEGDFQNVSANYLKSNRYGLKEDCLTNLQDIEGIAGSNLINKDFYTSCLGSYISDDPTKDIEKDNISNRGDMWNPYQFDKITNFASLLGNQINHIFGWVVEYHLNDPNENGIDVYLNEYVLKNIIDIQKIKVIVPDNKFPVESLIINQFNLDLFDTFEIHIMKEEFKNAFGIQRRPGEDDIVYICEANMLYYVKHSQAYKDVMNAATYYKVILEKYEYKPNIRNDVEDSRESIKQLTDNTTIEELFGDTKISEEDKIANKEQTKPTTYDFIRHKISKHVDIIKHDVVVDNFEIIKQYYDLSSEFIKNKTAIDYTKLDNNLKKSDNRSFITWFNINNGYSEDKSPNEEMFKSYDPKIGSRYNFIYNYNKDKKLGYDIYYKNNKIIFKINESVFEMDCDLLTNIWYSLVINMNQRQRNMNISLYGLSSDIHVEFLYIKTEPNPDPEQEPETHYLQKETVIYGSNEWQDLINDDDYAAINNFQFKDTANDFKLLYSKDFDIEPYEYEINNHLKIVGSDLKLSNIRIFDDLIPSNENVLKQYIVRDEQHLILGDNATKKLQATQFYNRNWR